MNDGTNRDGVAESLSDELLDFCKSIFRSEQGLRKIIESHGLTPNNHVNIRNYEFFLYACRNAWYPSVDEGIIRILLEYFPDAADYTSDNEKWFGWTPLHAACYNSHATHGIIQQLIDAAPDSVRRVDNYGRMPLHRLCKDFKADEIEAIEILKLLRDKCPESIRHADNEGKIPLHYAAQTKSPAFCLKLIEAYPGSEQIRSNSGLLPLDMACLNNKNATLDIIQLLIDAAPRSVRRVDIRGSAPLHYLCSNKDMDEREAIEILKLLLQKCPAAIRHADFFGEIPLHYAARARSSAFCLILIKAYPRSERIRSNRGILPFHYACGHNNRATVEYFYNLYPDAVTHASQDGEYPIHFAIRYTSWSLSRRADAFNIVKFLLDCHSNVILQKYRGMSLLRFACRLRYYDSNIDAGIQVIETLYDAHPEAIEGDELISDIQRCHHQVQAFLNEELVYSRQANDHRFMTTPDEYGQLPLHRALLNNVRLGSIKLLAKGNPSALRNADRNGSFPLHVACQYHESLSVIRYLLELDATTLRQVDFDGNAALHYACRGTKYDAVTMLLDEYNAASVSTWNVNGKLPIDLLFKSDEVEDRASIEYIDCVFRLLKANPQRLLKSSTTMKQQTKPENSLSSIAWLTVAVAVASWLLLFIYV